MPPSCALLGGFAIGALACLSVTLLHCGQTLLVGSKCHLSTEVGLGLGDIAFDRDSAAPHGKGHSSPLLFGPCLLWRNGRPSQLLLSSCCVCV